MYVGNFIEMRMRVDDVVGAVAVHGFSGFLGVFWVGVFAAGYPTGLNNMDSSIGGQLIGIATFLPLGFLSGWVAALILKKLNLLRVPPEVELEGLDVSEYDADLYLPEMARIEESMVEPDGTVVPSERILIEAEREVMADERQVATSRKTPMPLLIDSAPDCIVSNEAAEPADDSADFILQANYEECAGFMTFGPARPTVRRAPPAETLYYVLTVLGIWS